MCIGVDGKLKSLFFQLKGFPDATASGIGKYGSTSYIGMTGKKWRPIEKV